MQVAMFLFDNDTVNSLENPSGMVFDAPAMML
jgi:hypothetical protein